MFHNCTVNTCKTINNLQLGKLHSKALKLQLTTLDLTTLDLNPGPTVTSVIPYHFNSKDPQFEMHSAGFLRKYGKYGISFHAFLFHVLHSAAAHWIILFMTRVTPWSIQIKTIHSVDYYSMSIEINLEQQAPCSIGATCNNLNPSLATRRYELLDRLFSQHLSVYIVFKYD